MLLGDFNAEGTDEKVNNFDAYSLKNLVKGQTCFKSNNPKYFEILTIRYKSI